MIVLGFDPGLERVGFGVVSRTGSQVCVVEYGLIETPKIEIALRLKKVYDEASECIQRVQPDAIAMERLLFAANKTTALDVAKAIGVLLLATSMHNIPCFEYSPPEVKLSVVGTGNAEKRQVQYMVAKLLSLAQTPKPDDVADALAVALTHALRTPTR